MGYTTDFEGEIAIVPPLNEAERAYLAKFAETRRMLRTRGPYFVDGDGPYGQARDAEVRATRCQWVPNDDGTSLEWDQGEKFYDSPEWMGYLIEHFLQPGAHAASSDDPQFAAFTFDHVLNGDIFAEGEESGDRWKLVVRDNVVTTHAGTVTYPDDFAIGDKCPTCGEEWTGA